MEKYSNIFIIAYYLAMSLTGLITMGIDKRRAINKGWRISERTLLLIAFFGGGLGSYIGMKLFRHKTKHKRFVILLPIFLLLNLLALSYLLIIR